MDQDNIDKRNLRFRVILRIYYMKPILSFQEM